MASQIAVMGASLALTACGDPEQTRPMNGSGAGTGGSAAGSAGSSGGNGGSKSGSAGASSSGGSAGAAGGVVSPVALGFTLTVSDGGGCIINPDGDLECWGFLADGAPRAGSAEFASVSVYASGEYVCALDDAGNATCWSNGTTHEVMADGLFDQISVGDVYACAIHHSDRSVSCWLTTNADPKPVLEPPVGEFVNIATGLVSACGTRVDGSISCWGRASLGALDAPQGSFEQVATGVFDSCAVGSAGNACWGGAEPLEAPADRFKALSAAEGYFCGIREDGSISCWGEEVPTGQVPEGPFRALSAAPGLAASGHVCAVRLDGTLACWGTLSASQVPPAGLIVK